MKMIFLTQGKVAIVDDADYDSLNQYKWYADGKRGYFYAVRNSITVEGKKHIILMHRQILGLKRGDLRQGDHKDHDTLNNQRSNIRICSCQQNSRNQKILLNTSSRFKGVSWNKNAKKWSASLKINGKKKHLGYWNIEEVAALRHDMVAIREHGEFAYLNFN